jgi:hypothetical protein
MIEIRPQKFPKKWLLVHEKEFVFNITDIIIFNIFKAYLKRQMF